MRLNTAAFAVACALLWGLGLFLGTWWVIALEGASGDSTLIGRIYPGYGLTPFGSVAGLLWGLLDGLVG
ncbi:MAG: hypothetical protein ABEJ96_01470, partial [Thiohalorhabdaceae bacterium]